MPSPTEKHAEQTPQSLLLALLQGLQKSSCKTAIDDSVASAVSLCACMAWVYSWCHGAVEASLNGGVSVPHLT